MGNGQAAWAEAIEDGEYDLIDHVCKWCGVKFEDHRLMRAKDDTRTPPCVGVCKSCAHVRNRLRDALSGLRYAREHYHKAGDAGAALVREVLSKEHDDVLLTFFGAKMTNYIKHTMTVTGPEADRKTFFERHVVGGMALDFASILPIPEPFVFPPELVSLARQMTRDACADMARILTWGTKWEAFQAYVTEKGVLVFCTATEAPFPVFNKLVELWPTLQFHVVSKGTDVDYSGVLGVDYPAIPPTVDFSTSA
jgi:hypothetical protein